MKAVHSAIHDMKREVPANNFWTWIHNDYGIGTQYGRKIRLGINDRKKLAELVQIETGHNPAKELPHGDRIEMAKYVSNEKLATENPDENYILVKPGKAEIPVMWRMIPEAISYRVDHRRLPVIAFSSVVIIENLAAFDKWDKVKWVGPIPDLVIYRGHDAMAIGVKNFLARAPYEMQVYGFFDADYAGLMMAHGIKRLNGIVLPLDLQGTIDRRPGNASFTEKQTNAGLSLGRDSLEVPIRDAYDCIKKMKKDVTQEYMIAANEPVRVFRYDGK